ncbi:hypothetical protein L6452_31833 [Arctium lappa]|uniref:Uncharacterized protein n=1 Tax=Arctium lappa TaxID=4217 RepID=A0ACB8Z2L7_ARCLA|nr:hypothetical protein L6452_31833 [Arctium lappa]
MLEILKSNWYWKSLNELQGWICSLTIVCMDGTLPREPWFEGQIYRWMLRVISYRFLCVQICIVTDDYNSILFKHIYWVLFVNYELH